MKTRKLGQNGPEIAAVGYGAMSFSDFYGPTTEENSHAILDAMRDWGVNHIDTSNIYGMGGSEDAIGSYLSKNPEAKTFFSIATKASITRDADNNRIFRNDRAHLEAELDISLKRMGVDRVDLFYVHRRDPEMPIEEVVEGLVEIMGTGKIGSFGFSEIAPSNLRRAAAVHPVAAVQSEYSLQTRSPEMGLVQTCSELGTSLVAFSPVGRSLLTDHPLTVNALDELPFLKDNPRFQQPNFDANIAATDKLRALAKEMGEPAAALANAWLLAQGDQVIPIPGTRSVEHFRECVRGAEIDLSAEDLARIEAILPIGWAHGDRYSAGQWVGPERYC
ncbi:aldo/keto reductase [Alisedimentitalea sp. MJ-SS2]|uniref:aldo/keto reductase n=1 Tax=Aliisedimentitalea sp. MJ-SS2 TaxID=3049795 RepID=UPI00290CC02F|nr:aldo/keto reductase [Alisedimentitalea sp. MJ-SS2]MDU8926004.1 aldo/keto reductase [Alisedimentitalea sp. MJ-SS2]